ncbi:MAG: hypothetical protein JW896_18020, partial [Deltaproteobacteria bacterium]|nr:hypothetical protein [Deltaproteobacteria bacterium]
SSASADVALDAGADEPAEALCEGGSYIGNHGFTRGAPLGLSVFYDVFDFGLFFHVDPKGTKNGTILTKKQETVKGILA